MIVPEESWDGPEKKVWVTEYLEKMEWVLVSKRNKKRFICPKCSKEEW